MTVEAGQWRTDVSHFVYIWAWLWVAWLTFFLVLGGLSKEKKFYCNELKLQDNKRFSFLHRKKPELKKGDVKVLNDSIIMDLLKDTLCGRFQSMTDMTILVTGLTGKGKTYMFKGILHTRPSMVPLILLPVITLGTDHAIAAPLTKVLYAMSPLGVCLLQSLPGEDSNSCKKDPMDVDF